MRKTYDRMAGLDFEFYCAKLLRKNGFHHVTVTRGSSDQGIDIIACKNHKKYGIQCKCYSGPVGNKAVQEVYAGMKYYECDLAVVLTNRFFTDSAKALAKKTEVLLWDRHVLEELRKCQKTGLLNFFGVLGSVCGAALFAFLYAAEAKDAFFPAPLFPEALFALFLFFGGLFLFLEKGKLFLAVLSVFFSGLSLVLGLIFQNTLGGFLFLPLPVFLLSFFRAKKLRFRNQIFAEE